MRPTHWIDGFTSSLKFAVRQLTSSPGFTCLAVLTLALGIGANAAVFSVLKSVLLDALPYRNADRLVQIYGRRVDGSQDRGPLSAGIVTDLRNRQTSFENLAAFLATKNDAVYAADARPRFVTVVWVEWQFFDVLGIEAVHGRTFRSDDAISGLVPLSGGQGQDRSSGVVLTYQGWQQLFGGETIVGRSVRINRIPRTIIGILPEKFVGPAGAADFYFAMDLAPVADDAISGRGSQWLALIGRLKAGASLQQAEREVEVIRGHQIREHPQDSRRLISIPLQEALVGDTRTPLLAVMASALLVLLIACANLAGALLSRGLSRRAEFAIRTALGVGRPRLVRQLLTETALLGLIGGAAGLLLAVFLLTVLNDLRPGALPAHAELSLDRGAVLVTMVIALATGLLFGIVPAVSVANSDPSRILRDGPRGASENRRSARVRGVLVAAQIALCVSLLAGAGLLGRSLWEMSVAPLGVDATGVLIASVQLPPQDYTTPASRREFYDRFTDRLGAIPGVEAVADVSGIPTAVDRSMGVSLEGHTRRPDEPLPVVLATTVSDDYFRALRIPIRQGRTFDERDRMDATPTVVVSESMARRFWPAGAAVGTRLRIGPNPNAAPFEVIGVVGDVRNDRARVDAAPIAYLTARQLPPLSSRTFVIRYRGGLNALIPFVERELAGMDPALPLQRAVPLRDVGSERVAGRRLPVFLLTAFGTLALVLAAVGVYGMFAAVVAAREREFGVRIALGSRPSQIIGLVMRRGLAWMTLGLAVGAVGILSMARVIRSLLYQVSPFDPMTLSFSVAIVVVSVIVALLIPSYRASRRDPMTTLRAE